MEMSQENSLCSSLLQIKMFFFKNKNRKITSGRREDIKKGCRRVNVVEIVCTHV
jgi:hypothetical protein